jgi:hypothetical protein
LQQHSRINKLCVDKIGNHKDESKVHCNTSDAIAWYQVTNNENHLMK